MQAVAARLLAIEAEREQVDARELERTNVCLSRFFQENCTRGARRDAALARQKLLQEEVKLRRIEREDRVREQDLRIAEKQRERAEEAAAAVKAAQTDEARQRTERVEAARAAAEAAAQAPAEAAKPPHALHSRPRNPPLSAQPDAAQRAANRAAAEQREADARARQAEIKLREEKRRQRQAAQAAKKAAEAAAQSPQAGTAPAKP
jgi:colicin import membrane protein